MSNELFTTFSYFSKEEYEKLKQITKTLKEENTKASQSMLIRVAFNELINNKTIKSHEHKCPLSGDTVFRCSKKKRSDCVSENSELSLTLVFNPGSLD